MVLQSGASMLNAFRFSTSYLWFPCITLRVIALSPSKFHFGKSSSSTMAKASYIAPARHQFSAFVHWKSSVWERSGNFSSIAWCNSLLLVRLMKLQIKLLCRKSAKLTRLKFSARNLWKVRCVTELILPK